jgi:NAD(P) transhydrogenase subunit alpha
MSGTMIAIYVFTLACFVGYHVIWGVTPALHTPLMAVTNAISAILVIGAILVAGSAYSAESVWTQVIGFLAVMLASINIFGGFVVTNRILAMFKKKS